MLSEVEGFVQNRLLNTDALQAVPIRRPRSSPFEKGCLLCMPKRIQSLLTDMDGLTTHSVTETMLLAGAGRR